MAEINPYNTQRTMAKVARDSRGSVIDNLLSHDPSIRVHVPALRQTQWFRMSARDLSERSVYL